MVALAIARAESGWRPGAIGDVDIAGAKWGPSIGLWQIRSLREQAGTGRERDPLRLPDPLFNARSAWAISRAGRDWSAWSTYNSGAYRAHLDAARIAAGL